jgi:uncharacterized membrane protein
MLDSLAPLASATLRHVPTLVLLWLAFFFGRTLRAGTVPLIERIARIGKPDLSPALCRYSRGLTAGWSVYFVIAATLTATASPGFEKVALGVGAASALFFVGEHWIRRRIFPREAFPGLLQQIRDTVRVWRPRGDS